MNALDPIPSRNMIGVGDNKLSNCWEVMNCPKNLKKKCWVYRFNLGKECWILRKKARKGLNWKNPKGCNNCDFYNYISVQNIREK